MTGQPTPAAGQPSAPPPDDLLQLTVELAGSLDARTVMSRILERGLAVARADRATLSGFDADRLVIEASVGIGGEVTWVGRGYAADFLMRQPLVVELLATRKAVLGGGMSTADAMPEFRDALDKVKHTALVPILAAGSMAGMLVLSRYDDRPFATADIPNLTAFGALAGLALRNAKLYEQATSTSRRLQAATEAATDVAAIGDLSALLPRLIQHACESAGADSGAVMRIEGNEGVVESTSGLAPVGSRWPFRESVLAAVAAGRTIAVASDPTEITEELEPYASAYSHALVSPMIFSGELLGTIVLGRVHARLPFSDGDIAGLQQFSSLAALVLHNGRLVHRLREAESMKRDFINIAVHELRGPLTAIDGYAELLEMEGTVSDDDAARQLATIRRQAAHAKGLAEDLLILARIESDGLGVAREVVPLADAVAAAVERALPRARLRAGTIDVRITEAALAVADPALVARVLGNLLTNAVAYTVDAPSIRVTVSSEAGRALVAVADNGPGIPQDEVERIFARFARGSRSATVQGSGLGLYLSRECARRMGGDLVLESSGPAGSRFLLTLPAAP
ncbi:MAG TPA: ATP-binding protein [Candidatus Dormibacteraeota bacterium]|jgi:signal transduction histidine kinase